MAPSVPNSTIEVNTKKVAGLYSKFWIASKLLHPEPGDDDISVNLLG
jgi:hypothetical protein